VRRDTWRGYLRQVYFEAGALFSGYFEEEVLRGGCTMGRGFVKAGVLRVGIL
jgi:hypothetical protein